MCSHGGCGSSHIHTSGQEVSGSRWLYPAVNLAGVACLNEDAPGSGAAVIKSYGERLEPLPACTSDEGPELLFVVPFSEMVRVRSICVVRGRGITGARLWANRTDVDFFNAETTAPTSVLTGLFFNENGLVDFPLNAAKFSHVTSLCILLTGAGDSISLSCLGFKGEWTGLKDGVVEVCLFLSLSRARVAADYRPHRPPTKYAPAHTTTPRWTRNCGMPS